MIFIIIGQRVVVALGRELIHGHLTPPVTLPLTAVLGMTAMPNAGGIV